MNFYIDVQPEYDTPERQRSYAHYVATKPDMVAAKCLATEWLIQTLPKEKSIVEFFGGVGFFATLVENIIHPIDHFIFEINDVCVTQLRECFKKNKNVHVDSGDARKTILDFNCDILSLDFPNFTILDLREGHRWQKQFHHVFSIDAEAIVFTDTSPSYFSIHKDRYSQFFDKKLNSVRDYVLSFSEYLYKRYGYSVTNAAYRGRNACYYLARPGKHILEEADFPLEGNQHGFVLGD
jgi:hypothetical protein